MGRKRSKAAFVAGMASVLAAGSLLAGCSLNVGMGKSENKGFGKDESATIKVMYYDERQFLQQYGTLFWTKFPNVDIQVINMQGLYRQGADQKAEFKKMVEEQQPDLLMLQPDQYEEMAGSGNLYDLDTLIAKDKYDIAGIQPSILEAIKSKSAGKLYGLSPQFYSTAVFYNKDLFDKHGVSYPKDQMTWDELLGLAKRFPTTGEGDERVYGFYQNRGFSMGLYEFASSLGRTQNLSAVDPDSMKVTVKSEAWKKVFQTAIDTVKSGAMYVPETKNQPMSQPMTYESYLKQNLFVAGRAAMTIDGPYLLETMTQAQNMLKDIKPVNWDIVTVPVDPQNRDVSSTVSVSQIFAINAKSPNMRAAWELLKYMNGDEYAKIQSKATGGAQGLLARTAYMKTKDGRSLDAFFKLKPDTSYYYKGYDKIPFTFYEPFSSLADQELQAVKDGKKSLDEAISIIQDRGQEELTRAKQAEEAQKEAGKR